MIYAQKPKGTASRYDRPMSACGIRFSVPFESFLRVFVFRSRLSRFVRNDVSTGIDSGCLNFVLT